MFRRSKQGLFPVCSRGLHILLKFIDTVGAQRNFGGGVEKKLTVEIAVPVPLRRLFHYQISPDQLEQAQPGARALVPFRRRKMMGYILSCGTPAPEGIKLARVLEFPDELPTFTPALLRLLKWMSSYYLAPIGELMKAAHPPGTNPKGIWILELTEAGHQAETDEPTRVCLEQLRGGPQPLENLEFRPADSHLRRWVEAGWVIKRQKLLAPSIEVRKERCYRALLPPPDAPRGPGGRPLRRDEIHAWMIGQGQVSAALLRAEFKNSRTHLKRLIEEGSIAEEQVEVIRDPFFGASVPKDTPLVLTQAQKRAVQSINSCSGFQGFLLHGITGSGKTEVYLRVIQTMLTKGKGALVLVPEIALTPQLVRRFRARLGDSIAVLHSGLSQGARFDQWRRLRRGELQILIGARSGIFAPVKELGLIIVDEEHDPSFKQTEGVRYHGRDMALMRGLMEGAVVVLGSATPSLESLHNVRQKKLQLLSLSERPTGSALPNVEMVDLKKYRPPKDASALSVPLRDALALVLARKEQAILFLNRRGFSNVVLCMGCGEVIQCDSCAISMTWHQRQQLLVCHYCEAQRSLPQRCPHCGSTSLQLPGQGTERVEDDLQKLYPGARIARMDRDTATGHKLEGILSRMRTGKIDILVGTQMVTKGHDFPQVTLVGILAADNSLKFPDFRSAERTFQLLTQVAGRAGRGDRPGRVLVQTWDPEHFALQAVLGHDFAAFSTEELSRRRLLGYPPYRYALHFRMDGVQPKEVVALALRVERCLLLERAGQDDGVEVKGPAPAPIERIRGRSRWALLLLGEERGRLHELAEAVLRDVEPGQGLRLIVDVDPHDFL